MLDKEYEMNRFKRETRWGEKVIIPRYWPLGVAGKFVKIVVVVSSSLLRSGITTLDVHVSRDPVGKSVRTDHKSPGPHLPSLSLGLGRTTTRHSARRRL